MRAFSSFVLLAMLSLQAWPAGASGPSPVPGSTPAATPVPAAATGVSIEVDLTQQKAYLLLDGKLMYESRICSGRPGHATPTGRFTVIEKDQSHFSTLYGIMKDADGKVIDWNADSDMPVPKGGKFVAAPMEYFLRFDGANGLHAGIIQNYPASHGCVRLPKNKAILFFNIASVGTPVHVYGTPPVAPEPAPGAAKPASAASPSATPPARSKWFPWLKRLRG